MKALQSKGGNPHLLLLKSSST